ncbi:MAG: hypothetical protein B7Z12_04595 [Caulobacter vibrioides]|uniref:Probable membrane transporter protein n=1 Tax=Caulobacter vibrioides TaxID=155892 RepID=A0A258DAS9_CAUVI|nr:MAG: hypothetical protein B7Z12_04595 [Caulobacter vibrioides]
MVSLDVIATLFVVAALAGALDAIAGGGGLVTLPALLLAGLSPVQALGTNKLQGAVSAISSTSAFARRGLIDWKTAWPVALAAAAAGLCGALCASLPCFVAPLVGFYDGIFGPGAGAFYMVAIVTLLGYGALKATAHTKLANAASNLGSLVLFTLKGAVVWPVGLAMAAGAFIGAQVGSRLAMRFGPKLIRPLLVVISCAMAVKLLADPANPLRMAMGF